MKEGRKPEYPEKTPGDELQKFPYLPFKASGVIGSVLRLAGQVSIYCDWVR